MTVDLILSLDERLVEQARQVAQSMGTSLDQLVRGYLEEITSQSTAAEDMAELRRLSAEGKGRSRGWKLDRDEVHERS